MEEQYFCRGCKQVVHWGKIIRPKHGRPYHMRLVFDPEWQDDPKARDNTPDREIGCGPIVVIAPTSA